MTLVTRPSRYFEGILQVRNPRTEVIVFIQGQLRKGQVDVTKEVFVPEGIDLYVTSRKFLRTLANRLKAQFGGNPVLSSRLYTKDRATQKDVYRVSLLYRLPTLQKGNIVLFGQHVMKVKNVASFVTGIDVATGKQLSFRESSPYKILEVHETRVVKTHPQTEVLDPTTYQPVEVKNAVHKKNGEKVFVTKAGHDWYIV